MKKYTIYTYKGISRWLFSKLFRFGDVLEISFNRFISENSSFRDIIKTIEISGWNIETNRYLKAVVETRQKLVIIDHKI